MAVTGSFVLAGLGRCSSTTGLGLGAIGSELGAVGERRAGFSALATGICVGSLDGALTCSRLRIGRSVLFTAPIEAPFAAGLLGGEDRRGRG